MNEKTFDIINRIANEHCGKTFGYLNKDDLRNEIWLICLNKLDDFNYDRGELEHFLRVSVKNRLINRFKDITKSVRSPCPRCQYYDPDKSPSDCSKFGDEREKCNKWRNFQLSTESRNSLLNASEESKERDDIDDIISKIGAQEIKKSLISKLDKSYHYDIQKLMEGKRIPKERLRKLKSEVMSVLGEGNFDQLVELTIGKSNAGSK